MKKYLSAPASMKMRCRKSKIVNDIAEAYSYNFRKARIIDREDKDNAYEAGRLDGAVEVLSALLLSVAGGKEYYDFWEKTIAWAREEVEQYKKEQEELSRKS